MPTPASILSTSKLTTARRHRARADLANEGAAFLSAYCPSPVCVASRLQPPAGAMAAPHRLPLQQLDAPRPRLAHADAQRGGLPDARASERCNSRRSRATYGPSNRATTPKKAPGWTTSGISSTKTGTTISARCRANAASGYYIQQPSQLSRPHAIRRSGSATRRWSSWSGANLTAPFSAGQVSSSRIRRLKTLSRWNRSIGSSRCRRRICRTGMSRCSPTGTETRTGINTDDQGFDMNLIRLTAAAYYGTISFIDYNVGRILNDLERRGLLDETLILFTSDHGELLGDYGSVGKRSMLDAAFRVPLLARYPARFAAEGALTRRRAVSTPFRHAPPRRACPSTATTATERTLPTSQAARYRSAK